MSFQQFTLIELFEIFHCTYCLSRVCWIYVYQTIRRDKLPNPSTSNLSDAREKSLKISMHTLNGIRQSENCILLIYLISPSHEVCFWFVPSTSNAFRDWTNIGYKSIFICRWIIENRNISKLLRCNYLPYRSGQITFLQVSRCSIFILREN